MFYIVFILILLQISNVFGTDHYQANRQGRRLHPQRFSQQAYFQGGQDELYYPAQQLYHSNQPLHHSHHGQYPLPPSYEESTGYFHAQPQYYEGTLYDLQGWVYNNDTQCYETWHEGTLYYCHWWQYCYSPYNAGRSHQMPPAPEPQRHFQSEGFTYTHNPYATHSSYATRPRRRPDGETPTLQGRSYPNAQSTNSSVGSEDDGIIATPNAQSTGLSAGSEDDGITATPNAQSTTSVGSEDDRIITASQTTVVTQAANPDPITSLPSSLYVEIQTEPSVRSSEAQTAVAQAMPNNNQQQAGSSFSSLVTTSAQTRPEIEGIATQIDRPVTSDRSSQVEPAPAKSQTTQAINAAPAIRHQATDTGFGAMGAILTEALNIGVEYAKSSTEADELRERAQLERRIFEDPNYVILQETLHRTLREKEYKEAQDLLEEEHKEAKEIFQRKRETAFKKLVEFYNKYSKVRQLETVILNPDACRSDEFNWVIPDFINSTDDNEKIVTQSATALLGWIDIFAALTKKKTLPSNEELDGFVSFFSDAMMQTLHLARGHFEKVNWEALGLKPMAQNMYSDAVRKNFPQRLQALREGSTLSPEELSTVVQTCYHLLLKDHQSILFGRLRFDFLKDLSITRPDLLSDKAYCEAIWSQWFLAVEYNRYFGGTAEAENFKILIDQIFTAMPMNLAEHHHDYWKNILIREIVTGYILNGDDKKLYSHGIRLLTHLALQSHPLCEQASRALSAKLSTFNRKKGRSS